MTNLGYQGFSLSEQAIDRCEEERVAFEEALKHLDSSVPFIVRKLVVDKIATNKLMVRLIENERKKDLG